MSAEGIPEGLGIICSSDDYTRSLVDSSVKCLTRSQSIGLTMVVETGVLSLVTVLGVFVLIIRNAVRHIRQTPGKWNLVQEPMDVFMLSLFSADLAQAIGAVLDIKWVHDGKVQTGKLCTAQGVIQQLGETGVAITTLVIALYTLIVIWSRKGVGAVWTAKLLVGIVWLFILIIVIVGNVVNRNKENLFQAPTPYWCWLGEDYLGLRIAGEYIWFWLTLAVSFVAYVPLYFWSRGNITFHERSRWGFTVHHRARTRTGSLIEEAEMRNRKKNSMALLAYPVLYSCLILPLSVVRWIGFVQERGGNESHISAAATLSVCAVYNLGGFANVVLLMWTRPNSVLFGKSHTPYSANNGEGRAPSPQQSLSSANDYSQRNLNNNKDLEAPAASTTETEDRESRRGSNRTSDGLGLELGRLPSRLDEESW